RPPPFSSLFPYTTLFRSVSCYPHGQTVGRRDRPRIGALCPLGRLVSGVGDHIIGDRPRPDPVWETAHFSVTPAPTALLRLCPMTDRKSTRLNSSHLGISY